MYKSTNKAINFSLMTVTFLAVIVWLLYQFSSNAAVRSVYLTNTVYSQHDSLIKTKKVVDSALHEAKVNSDAASAAAKANQAKQDSINRMQQVISEQAKEAPSAGNDTDNWKEKYLAAISENVLLKEQLSRQTLIKAAADKPEGDTIRTKPRQASFDAPYSLFSRGNQQQLPRLQINAAFQLSHSWLNMTNSVGIGGNIYWKHLRIYNGINYNIELKKIGGTSSVGYDIFNIYKSKK